MFIYKCWRIILALHLSILAVLLEASEPTTYLGRKIAYTMHSDAAAWLVRQGRDREENTAELIKALDLKKDMVVADVGCGIGYHTFLIAPQVASVLCIDIQEEMLKQLKARAETNNVTNIELILGDLDDPKLPTGKVDLVLLVDAYHEFSDPASMLFHIRNSLSENGVIALVEFRLENQSVPIKKDHKMSKEQIMKEWTANGFRLDRSYDELPWQHLMFFEKDNSAQP